MGLIEYWYPLSAKELNRAHNLAVIHDQVGEIRPRFWIDFQSLFDLPQTAAYGGRQSELNPTNDATI
jgi:hypothetical protein|tara:strand:- start:4712 stop:4912 length:201 start_codon:yes stop_codon:yes gene_type:complete